jgi:hypothetical protein
VIRVPCAVCPEVEGSEAGEDGGCACPPGDVIALIFRDADRSRILITVRPECRLATDGTRTVIVTRSVATRLTADLPAA